MKSDTLTILNLIAQAIYDKKGQNILALDVRGISTITQYVLIAEGLVERHVIALGQWVAQTLKEKGEAPYHVEGMQVGDWVVVDCVDLMVHIFLPQVREKYRLEELWREGEIVDLGLQVKNEG
jgi:ribosome-associated protein